MIQQYNWVWHFELENKNVDVRVYGDTDEWRMDEW